jgi:hypothetical protein
VSSGWEDFPVDFFRGRGKNRGMAIPTEERLDLHVSAALKAAVMARAEEAGLTLNDHLTDVLCKAYGLRPEDYRVRRKRPGRPPNVKTRKGAK